VIELHYWCILIYTHHEQAQRGRLSEPRRLYCILAFKAWVETRDYFSVGLLVALHRFDVLARNLASFEDSGCCVNADY